MGLRRVLLCSCGSGRRQLDGIAVGQKGRANSHKTFAGLSPLNYLHRITQAAAGLQFHLGDFVAGLDAHGIGEAVAQDQRLLWQRQRAGRAQCELALGKHPG